jgi:hypothetical protein
LRALTTYRRQPFGLGARHDLALAVAQILHLLFDLLDLFDDAAQQLRLDGVLADRHESPRVCEKCRR